MSSTGRRLWPAAVATLCAFAVLVSLGTWQVQRLQWKQGLIASIEARMAAAPAPLADIVGQFAQTGDVDYTPVTVSGVFDHGAEQHFFATHKGASGYYVYTPLRTGDGGTVFVNRGFVPFDRKDPATRPAGQVAASVSVTGLARNPLDAKPSRLVPDNDVAANVFYWKDITAMAARAGLQGQAGLLGFFIDADDAPNPGGLPIGAVTIVDLPNNHLQYAITWYGLALALVGVFVVWLRRRDG